MKKWKIILSVIILCVVVLYIFFSDYLPPRNPLKIARLQSGFIIPRDVSIEKYDEKWGFSGDGYVFIVLKLNDEQYKSIRQQFLKNNFKKLPIKESKFPFLDKYIESNDEGIYMLDQNPENYETEIVAINDSKLLLIIYYNVS